MIYPPLYPDKLIAPYLFPALRAYRLCTDHKIVKAYAFFFHDSHLVTDYLVGSRLITTIIISYTTSRLQATNNMLKGIPIHEGNTGDIRNAAIAIPDNKK